MAWIAWVDEADAEGRVAAVYAESSKLARPFPVSHIKKIHSLHPEALSLIDAFDKVVRRGQSGLTRAQREMIALVVSVLNGCHYWIVRHSEAARAATFDPRLVEQLQRDHRQADLAPRDRAMLAYVAKLTLTPARMTKADVDALRRHGFSDRDILDVAMMTGLFAYFDRIADGLGVELEAPFR